MINVALIGHSYVRSLSFIGAHLRKFKNNCEFQIKYYYIKGSTFETWNDFPPKLHSLFGDVPDIVVVILGGNCIVDDVSDTTLKHNAKVFFQILRNNLSEAIIIATQVELRFYNVPNKFNAQGKKEYRKRRNKFNEFLKKCKEINFFFF